MILSLYRKVGPWVHRTAAAALLGICTPATAITFGQPDGDAHPFVGSMVVSIPGEGNRIVGLLCGIDDGCAGFSQRVASIQTTNEVMQNRQSAVPGPFENLH